MIDKAVEYAMKIPGFMPEAGLRWLATQAVGKSCIVEVGCLRGRSTSAIAGAMDPDGVIYCIDPWLGDGYKGLGVSAFEEFQKNMSPWTKGFQVFAIRAKSCEVWNIFHYTMGPECDMIFIDGAHDMESVMLDIQWGLKCLKPNGLLCGHDAHPDNPCGERGVCDALERQDFNWSIVHGTSIWVRE